MKWEPDENAFGAFAKFEMRRGDEAAARKVFEVYVDVHPTLRAFLKYARWEEKQGQVSYARGVYERALLELPDEEERQSERLFTAFATFEERCREHDRARVIYKYALDSCGREAMPDLYKHFIALEKKHGSRAGIEEVVVGKRRLQYEEAVAAAPHDYDAWFDYARLEEEEHAAHAHTANTTQSGGSTSAAAAAAAAAAAPAQARCARHCSGSARLPAAGPGRHRGCAAALQPGASKTAALRSAHPAARHCSGTPCLLRSSVSCALATDTAECPHVLRLCAARVCCKARQTAAL